MLEGLEISEIQLSALERTFRIDAQFYSLKNLSVAKRLEALNAKPLTQFACVSDGNHMSISEGFVESGIPYYRGQNVGNFFIEQSLAPAYIEQTIFVSSKMVRSRLQKGDVLLSIVGTVGGLSLVKTDADAACSCKLAILRPKAISAELLAIFLTSNYGQLQIHKFRRGTVQTGLLLEDFNQLKIPIFSEFFEITTVSVVNSAFKATEAADKKFADAREFLLTILGISYFFTTLESVNIKSLKNSFIRTGRLDAEYYSPAKEGALAMLNELSDCTVGDLFDSIRNLWQPDKGDSVDKVRNYDLSDALSPFLDDSKEPVERTAIASTKKVINGGDLVVSRLRSYLKEIAIVKAGDETLMVASTEFIVLRPKATTTLPVEALLVYLRSELPQLVFKWSQDGSNHPRFDEGELLRLPVPRALIAQGGNFVETIQTVIASRERANQLLEAAKRAVEIAIEQDEAAGMAYLAREGALT